MSKEYKLVPVEPTDEMEEAGCQAYMKADGKNGPFIMHLSSMGWAFKAMIAAAAPVPPAGDVEVVVYAYGPAKQRQYVEPDNAFLGWHFEDATPLVDRAHVTRLQAGFKEKYQDHKRELDKAWNERDALKAEVERLTTERDAIEHNLNKVDRAFLAQQSELTKVRELLEEAATAIGEYGDSLIGRCNVEAGTTMLDLERKLRAHQHQPAPACKHEWVQGACHACGMTESESAPSAKPVCQSCGGIGATGSDSLGWDYCSVCHPLDPSKAVALNESARARREGWQ